jgi:hypothetical protein
MHTQTDRRCIVLKSPQSSPGNTRLFGPFIEVPSHLVRKVGFTCPTCRNPLERLAQVVPYLVPRVVLTACDCGCVVTWEDEHQVKSRRGWQELVGFMKRTGMDVIIFNGNRPTPPGFSGIN